MRRRLAAAVLAVSVSTVGPATAENPAPPAPVNGIVLADVAAPAAFDLGSLQPHPLDPAAAAVPRWSGRAALVPVG